MHNELNSSKGDIHKLRQQVSHSTYFDRCILGTILVDHDHVGPIVFFNKDNAAAAISSDPLLKT